MFLISLSTFFDKHFIFITIIILFTQQPHLHRYRPSLIVIVSNWLMSWLPTKMERLDKVIRFHPPGYSFGAKCSSSPSRNSTPLRRLCSSLHCCLGPRSASNCQWDRPKCPRRTHVCSMMDFNVQNAIRSPFLFRSWRAGCPKHSHRSRPPLHWRFAVKQIRAVLMSFAS